MAKAYYEVAAELRKRIQGGVYHPESPLPSERTLVQEFDIHRATLRRALNLLTTEGLLSREPGRRAFPNPRTTSAQRKVGLFAAEPTDSYARSLVAGGVSHVLDRQAPDLRFVWSNVRPFQLGAPSEDAGAISPDSLAGLILWPPKIADIDRMRHIHARMPVILIDMRVPGFESDFVGFRDMDAGYAAARHLYEVGHRRLAFIGETIRETAQYRRLGFMKFCEEAGIEPLWRFGPFDGAISTLPPTLVTTLLGLPREECPTAAVCSNDETAAAMIGLLAQSGVRVPDDLALMGFGGAQRGLLNALGLTTMEQPYEAVGEEAARLLLARLDQQTPQASVEVRLPMKLVVRTSSGLNSSPR